MRPEHGWLAVLLLISFLSACSGDSGTGPVEPRWDRVACERCRMVLSDHHYAAQIRYLPPGKRRTRVALFDDIGCALLWLQDKPWKDDPRVRIWVADYRNGDWIDARKATYIKGKISPMGYGLGAQPEADPKGLNFAQAWQYIQDEEASDQRHAEHLLQRFQALEQQHAAGATR